ncbi:Cd(II)/Pb(II)-responsive transcriptional regulator [Ectopseudomonas mendocina]|jgi:Cd(II)/Pb(II)-responsive transcriptional regulator|uniref:Cd(II)/Pb(II)-responsive transcriptional regulator n=2 Tax=Ectopseudomonas mendocina TaxID=300 RepID=A0ABD7RV01_ECTME|nr:MULTISPECIES: Cd(II)/Pb(II)-responsive transcriptional regulator [Pseudomonas]ALN17429.1 Cd(II)/Pb(II)-responsive transcriptional regulator [Pseudomonas mendocina S5.2]KES01761.1 Cd(II)/Pb(II)-responsive transcriptional regulator [Pseudomonas mendocina]MDF2075750.1 Cd(II)/Pb(II)-responsive transcriptional regulator [Pseudomonas mendocina]TRO11084.1 Cd(II)/Pb(II)-responsive transcriptional regulator [Pseudomonas mendocina]TRO17790.1 Cd(II)/Pb(II)-responsive transcriptional regulator [Pseudom
MKIGDLAKKAGCQVETVRYYEREGLLPAPARTEGNYRLYGSPHLERLVFIRNCRTLDMTLEEIQRLLALRDLPHESCAGINSLVDEHIEHVEARINSLLALRDQLTELRDRCNSPQESEDCGILRQLNVSGGVQPLPDDGHTHVGKSHSH